MSELANIDYSSFVTLKAVKQALAEMVSTRTIQFEQLTRRINNLSGDKVELRRVELVRSIASATQFALTEQFPGLFTKTKFPYACTYDVTKEMVAKKKYAKFSAKLVEVTGWFSDVGIHESDISNQIQVIGEVGTGIRHTTTMINADNTEYTEYTPSPAELLGLIDACGLPEDKKDTAKNLVKLLIKLHPEGTQNILVNSR